MDVNDTAYNAFVMCSDCESGSNEVAFDSEYDCPRWGMKVKNVGICKHYRKAGAGDGNSEN